MKRSRRKVEEEEKENIKEENGPHIPEANGNCEKAANGVEHKKLKIEANGHADAKQNGEPKINWEEKFKGMCLRKIIKENHGAPLKQVAFNNTKACNSNLVATVGDNQASIYDNEHFGSHLDLMCNYVNPAAEKDASNELNTCIWLGSETESDTDTYLAMGGADGVIQIISVAQSRVVCQLKGHRGSVVELAMNPVHKGLLLSGSTDGTVLMWNCFPMDTPYKKPVCCFQGNSLNLAWLSDGTGFISGSYSGTMRQWAVPSQLLEPQQKPAATAKGKGKGKGKKAPAKKGGKKGKAKETENEGEEEEEQALVTVSEFKKLKKKHLCDIDCIRCYEDKCVSKSVDGRIYVWDIESEENIHNLKVPNCSGTTRSFMDIHTSDKGQFLCAGNSRGVVFVFNLQTGKEVTRLEYKRIKTAARSVVFAPSLEHIILVGYEPFIWRWSWPEAPKTDDKEEEKEQEKEKEEDKKDKEKEKEEEVKEEAMEEIEDEDD